MIKPVDLEQRRKRIETLVKVAGLCGIAFIVSPFIFLVIKGLLGMLVSGAIGITAISFWPAVATTFANWRLKAVKAAIAADPISSLENIEAERTEALKRMRDNVQQSQAVLQDLYAQIQQHDVEFPGKPSQYLDKYNKLFQLVQLRGKKYQQAKGKLAEFHEVIKEKRSDWKIAQTMAAASKLAEVGEDFMSKLKEDTALTTVQDGLNFAFADLETSLLDEAPVKTPASVSAPQPAKAAGQNLLPSPESLDLGFDVDHVIDAETVTAKRKTR